MRLRFAFLAGSVLLSACGGGGGDGAQQAETPAPPPQATPAQRLALVASLPAPYNQGDVENGRRQFGVCRSCHTLTPGGADMVGPNLYGVFGRPAGTHGRYAYSQQLRDSGTTWDAATLDRWIENPRAMVPGTKMVFAGVRDATRRRDLIAYLRAETSPAP